MHAELQADVEFHLTGGRTGGELGALQGPGLRPALLAAYRDLTRLRYDFPLVLRDGGAEDRVFEPLSELVDRVVADLGGDAERLRAHALRLEQDLRASAATVAAGSLAGFAAEAERRLARGGDAAFTGNLGRLRAALEKAGGELVDCGAALPARLVAHAWRAVQLKKAETFRGNIERLILKLGDILRVDAARSPDGRSPASLKAAVGSLHEQAFDFDAMARLLAPVSARGALSESRRARLESTLATLKSQRFYAAPGGEALAFQFDSSVRALRAFRERMPAMLRLAKAITLAELELEGEFSAPRHDALFEQLAARGLDLRDLAQFPDYLVCVALEDLRGREQDALLEILAGGLPMKILVQSDDLLEDALRGTGHVAVGARSRQLAGMALGLSEVYVLQASGSHLPRMRERMLQAMRFAGPALISVFSGAHGHAGDLPPYLVAAAAMEARAFPAFAYNPAAGPDWASRFALEGNPQAERDWPLHPLAYEDSAHQRVGEEVAFTLIDFFACDLRYAGHFAALPQAHRSARLAAAAECVAREWQGVPDKVPSLLLADGDSRLQQVIVDDRLIREARRCRDHWHQLQELGGINNSHAERLLARERKNWEEAQRVEIPAAVAAAPAAAATPAEPEQEFPPDEPYIETARCSSCDECIQINNRMFAYDANKQARIVDLRAGTYRQLVEAAESCQVAVIHPGKPKNPDEPGLEDLLKRAESFL